jgi:hypothetical protein
MCAKAVEFMSQGFSKEAFAGELGVCARTIYNWAENNPEFLQAIKDGEAASIRFWESLGRRGSSGEIPGFSAAAWIFNMKNRAGWRDKMEHTGEGGGPIQTTTKVLSVVGVPADTDSE